MSDKPIASSLLRQEGPQQDIEAALRAIVESAGPAGFAHDSAASVVATALIDAARLALAAAAVPSPPYLTATLRALAIYCFQKHGNDAYLYNALADLVGPEVMRGVPSTPVAPPDLLARLRDYHDQVLQGVRHISRVEEAGLIQAAIDGLRQTSETGWQPIMTAPRHERCFFWVVPKTADECPTNTSGKPITMEGRGEPHRVDGEWGWWGALWKPLYWMPMPKPPSAPVHPVPPAEGEK